VQSFNSCTYSELYLQQNMSMLEDEQKTMAQLGLEDDIQFLIEGM
jgi:hypothetical protein